MSSRRRKALPAILLIVAAVGAGAGAFLPGSPTFLLLSLLPAVAVATALAAGTGAAVILAIGASVVLVMAEPRLDAATAPPIPLLIAAAWVGIFLTDWHTRRDDARRREERSNQDIREDEARAIRKEISFYEARAAGLSQRAELRRSLSRAAVELGAVLEPARIQDKLITLSQSLFSGAEVALLTPERAGAAEGVFQRGQAVLVQDAVPERSVMAAPIRTGHQVIAALSVSVASRSRVFAWDDLRLLDVLAGLASEALDNATLFNNVRENALHDGLTGLLTRRAFDDRLESAALEASRYHKPLSLIMADIDRFKSVNDTHGHPAGDAILQGFAHVLDRNLRDVDVLARYGGEEFVVILYETSLDEAVALADRIRADLAEQPFDVGGGRTLAVTASFGVASFPQDATSAQQLLRQADQRLYAAKNGGRNRVVGGPL